MRVYVQKQLIEMLQTIWDGVKYAKAKNNKENAESVLMDCYVAVNSIETAMQSGFSPERFSKYSEALNILKAMLEYMNNAIATDESVSEVSDDIKKQIKFIKNELNNENEVKLEIVFMPYNANMWDSLESIWIAANGDEKCDVYVVPIPYYNRNPDYSFGELKFEGNDFPNYVPIVHYNNYDLNIRKPDIIYIHNPYDEFNYVTSIDPKYYSYELKKYTDMLVYVPYFVSGEIIGDNFCATSAVKNADIIIAQSLSAKNCYARYADATKVLALGSPKIDKVINTKKEDITLPDEWKSLIKNKKVVLYNTHLSGMMGQNFNYLNHLKYILHIFETNKDIVLWWRPHPLAEDTIKSMNPAIIKLYNDIVNNYKAKKFGIFDDTKDFHRAISISDMYYGDISSVVLLYQATGKPVCHQNVNINKKQNKNDLKISAWSFAIQDKTIWFVPNNICGLFSKNLITNETKYHGGIPNTRIFDYAMYTSIQIAGDHLVLIPGYGRDILLYDTNNHVFRNINYTLKQHIHLKFINSYCYGDDIYLIPYMYESILRYNIKTNKLIEIHNICFKLNTYRINNLYYFYGNQTLNNHTLMLATCTSNTITEYNLKSNKVTMYNVGPLNCCYNCIIFDGVCYWLFTTRGNIYKWNKSAGEINELTSFPDKFKQNEFNFIQAIFYKGFVYAFPNKANMILKINTQTHEISCFANIDERENNNTKDYNFQKYLYANVIDEYIYAWSQYEGCLQKINPDDGSIENLNLNLSDEDYKEILSNELFNPQNDDNVFPLFAHENPILNLEFLLERLANESINTNKVILDNLNLAFSDLEGNSGIEIHKKIKSLIKK